MPLMSQEEFSPRDSKTLKAQQPTKSPHFKQSSRPEALVCQAASLCSNEPPLQGTFGVWEGLSFSRLAIQRCSPEASRLSQWHTALVPCHVNLTAHAV